MKIDLQQHREAEAKATKGPWNYVLDQTESAYINGYDLTEPDADLVVLLRNDHAAMLDELERLYKREEQWQQAFDVLNEGAYIPPEVHTVHPKGKHDCAWKRRLQSAQKLKPV